MAKGLAVLGENRVIVGAWKNDTGATDAGAAYLFTTNGTLLTTFTNPTPEAGDYFGHAVAGIGADKILIGAYGDNTGAESAGAAYLFTPTRGGARLLTTFTNPAPEANDWFGWSLSGVGEDRVLIGAYRDNSGAEDTGVAFLFSTDGTLLTTFTNPTPEEFDGFGRGAAGLGSGGVLIGAFRDNADGEDAGAAYLFSVDGRLRTTFTKPNPKPDSLFGSALSGVGSDSVLVGACAADHRQLNPLILLVRLQRRTHSDPLSGVGLMDCGGIMPQSILSPSFRIATGPGSFRPGIPVAMQGDALDSQQATPSTKLGRTSRTGRL